MIWLNLKIKSFELNPYTNRKVVSKTDERFAKKYGMTLEEARNEIEEISKMGRDEGIDFRYADTLYTNMLDAHRLTKLAESKGKDINKIIHLLFDAYFTKNLVLSDKSVLIKIGIEVGLKKKEIIKMIESEAFLEDVRKDENEAHKAGVFGVPYFVINDIYIISGCESKDEMKKMIICAIDNELIKSKKGMVCGPDGCH